MASLLTASKSNNNDASKKRNKEHSIPRRKRREQQQQLHHQGYHNDDDDDEEQRLTAKLFGATNDTSATIENSQSHSKKMKRPETKKNERAAPEGEEYTFEIDRTGTTPTEEYINQTDEDPRDNEIEEETPTAKAIEILGNSTKRTVAWVDHDEDEDGDAAKVNFMHASDRIRKLRQYKEETHIETRSLYEERLRQRYIQTTQTTSNVAWAKTGEDGNRMSNDVASISASYLDDNNFTNQTKIMKAIPPHTISMKRCPDANRNDPNQSVTKVVQFYHPSNDDHVESPALLLTAGLDKALRFFHCSEEASTKIHGVHFPNFPIYSASFIGTSSNVVVTGRRPFFYVYDTVADKVQKISKIPNRNEKSWERCVVSPHDNDTIALLGNDGYIILYNILQQKPCTTQPIKLNGSVRTVAFNPYNTNELLASGSDGDIYRYDIRYLANHKCIERFHNDDGTITSQIATSSQTFAVGAESGVVNIYQNNSRGPSLLRGLSTTTSTFPLQTQPQQQRKPMKSIMNIKTCIDTMTYNHDGDLLAISSRFEKDCLKLVHVPTGTVYSNWPTSNTPLGYVFSVAFSPHSNYMAIGNDQGKCLLYKLMHYE